MKIAFLGCIVIATFAGMTFGKVLPDYIKQCKRKDPEFVKCTLNSVELLRERLKKGIPKIQLPAFEPLEIPTLSIARDQPAIQIQANLTNMKVFGASKFKIEKLKVDLDKYAAAFEITLPELFVESDYDIKGSRILVLPLEGDGHMKVNISDTKVVARGSAKVIEKKGVKYLHLEKLSIKVKVKNTVVNFRDPNRPLQAETNQAFFNNNVAAILDLIYPIAEETGAFVVSAFVNRILGTVPLHELLPED